MKVRRYVVAAGLCWLLSMTAYAQNDSDAIKSVIIKETTSFFAVDKKSWEANWLDAPFTYWTSSDSLGGGFVEGTENIKQNFDEYFRTAKPSKSSMIRDWREIRIYGKGAYVRFIQKVNDGIDTDETSEVRVLEKDKDGKWKIIFLNATAMYAHK